MLENLSLAYHRERETGNESWTAVSQWLGQYKPNMDCPKCGHRQDDTVKCESCGVYFAKLQSRPAPTASRAGSSPNSGTGAGAIVITAVLTAALVVGFMRMRNTTPETVTAPKVNTVQSTTAVSSPRSAPALPGAGSQALGSANHASPLEAARSATVLIKTGWGLGSGFIVDAHCHVITNRHVVETDGTRVANTVVQDPGTKERLALAQQQLVMQINKEEELRRALEGRPGTNLEQAELDRHIAQMREQLADLSSHLEQTISQRVEAAGRAGFTAVLPDGREFNSLHADFDSNVDLALFQLPVDGCAYIPAGRSTELAVGQRLYSIGNPSGLTYTVTSGVFSGHRLDGHNRLLQTDAPINPGNSGGPLITEEGRVIGINTMVLRGTQGIGFAIPIESAFDGFPQLGRD